jgi:hypothetical protein
VILKLAIVALREEALQEHHRADSVSGKYTGLPKIHPILRCCGEDYETAVYAYREINTF